MIYLMAILVLLSTASAKWQSNGSLLLNEPHDWRLNQGAMLSGDTWSLTASSRQERGELPLARLSGALAWRASNFRLLAGDMHLRDRLGLVGRGSRLSFPTSGMRLIRPGPATASTWQQGERGICLEAGKRRVLTLGLAQSWRDTRADKEGYALDLVRSPDKAARINAWQDQLVLAGLRQEGERGAAEVLLAVRRAREPLRQQQTYGSLRLQRPVGSLLLGTILHTGEAKLALVDLSLRRSTQGIWRVAAWRSSFTEGIWSRPVLAPRSGRALALAWQGRIDRLRLRSELRREVPDDGPAKTRLVWECVAPHLLPAGWELVARSSLIDEGVEAAGAAARLLRVERASNSGGVRLEYRQRSEGDKSFSALAFQVEGSRRANRWDLVSRLILTISTDGDTGAWVPGSTPGLVGSRYLRAGSQVAIAGLQLRRNGNSIALQAGVQERDAWIRLGWSFQK